MDKYLTLKEIGALTALSESFWRKLVARGELRTFKFGRSIRVLEEDVRQYLAARERPARVVRASAALGAFRSQG